MIVAATTFDQWRAACRDLLAAGVPPTEVRFDDARTPGLFGAYAPPATAGASASVPPRFLVLARAVACHRDPRRWDRLYRALWRLTRGEPHLLDLATDDDVRWLSRAEKAVRRDCHKMVAFVRFRAVDDHFVAWHRPDHRIVRRVAPFFARRFPQMLWSILTPNESVTWDGGELHYGPGAPAPAAPSADAIEDLWKTYYRSTFNPARLRVRAMKKELPVRHWPTLPEAALIPELIAGAAGRTSTMVAHTEGLARTAEDFFPAARDLNSLREAARGCAACELCGPATQTVFGEGPADARVVLVGEQPGDREDREGRPFVGPAGALLDSALEGAGLSRDRVYLTNAVKHFKFGPHEYFRMHHRADVREQAACRPWLVAELDAIDPTVIVCLGATAARAVLGPVYRSADRGDPVPTAWRARAVPTYHPAAVLRHPDPERAEAMRADLVRHLVLARRLAAPGAK